MFKFSFSDKLDTRPGHFTFAAQGNEYTSVSPTEYI